MLSPKQLPVTPIARQTKQMVGRDPIQPGQATESIARGFGPVVLVVADRRPRFPDRLACPALADLGRYRFPGLGHPVTEGPFTHGLPPPLITIAPS